MSRMKEEESGGGLTGYAGSGRITRDFSQNKGGHVNQPKRMFQDMLIYQRECSSFIPVLFVLIHESRALSFT